MSVRKKRKFKKIWRNLFFYSIIIVFIILLFISGYHITSYKREEIKINEQLDEINDLIYITETENTEETNVIEQIEEIPESNPYWDYINMNLINVDFNNLKEINKDVKGWIQVNGTNINYPFVQKDNNEYYLTHSFNNSYNSAGWVFLDYRNDLSNSNDKNTIIYAHGRLDKTMFGSLRNILTNGWLTNTNNYIVKLSTEYENTLWQVFSVYHIPTTSDYIQVNFNSNEEFNEWASMLISRSSHNFDTTVNENDHILTLSTCYNESEKVVLHAKLIKRETK